MNIELLTIIALTSEFIFFASILIAYGFNSEKNIYRFLILGSA